MQRWNQAVQSRIRLCEMFQSSFLTENNRLRATVTYTRFNSTDVVIYAIEHCPTENIKHFKISYRPSEDWRVYIHTPHETSTPLF